MSSVFESIRSWLRKDQEQNDVPEGFCPNCWGRQEYGGQLYEALKNEGVDVNSVSEKKGWIQDYAEKHLVGIQLKVKDDALICGTCKVTYRRK